MNNESKKIEVSESNLKAALGVAYESTKKVLEALLGKIEPPDDNKPSLKDYKSIRSYADACKALRESVDEKTLKKAGVPKHIIAQMKLELICKALWGGEVKVYPDPECKRRYYYPWFFFYTKDEVERMDSEERVCLLSAGAGLDCLAASSCSSRSLAACGFRLYLDTYEKARYFGTQFLELWAEVIDYNFSVGE